MKSHKQNGIRCEWREFNVCATRTERSARREVGVRSTWAAHATLSWCGFHATPSRLPSRAIFSPVLTSEPEIRNSIPSSEYRPGLNYKNGKSHNFPLYARNWIPVSDKNTECPKCLGNHPKHINKSPNRSELI